MAQLQLQVPVIRVGGLEIGPDYVFSTGKRLEGGPYRRAKKYLRKRDRKDGKLYCEIGGERILGKWEVHHRGPMNAHVARLLGIACRTHNAGGHEFRRFLSSHETSPSAIRSLSPSAEVSQTTKQIDINQGLYPAYLTWLEDETAEKGKVLLDWAIYEAARQLHEKLGYGHWKTLQGYLKMLVSGRRAPYFVDGQYLCRASAYEEGRQG